MMAVIGVGIDLVDVEDAVRLLDRWGERLLRRVLTEREREYVLGKSRPARFLAVRLAAKEAVYKSLQTLPGAAEIAWREIEVERGERGRPSVLLHGRARRLLEAGKGLRIHLSLTHTDRSAGAVAIVESP